jgi:hypothetical protein
LFPGFAESEAVELRGGQICFYCSELTRPGFALYEVRKERLARSGTLSASVATNGEMMNKYRINNLQTLVLAMALAVSLLGVSGAQAQHS